MGGIPWAAIEKAVSTMFGLLAVGLGFGEIMYNIKAHELVPLINSQSGDLMIYGFIVALYELKPGVGKYFAFLSFLLGKGVYFVLMGVYSYAMAYDWYESVERFLSCGFIIYGFLLTLLHFVIPKEHKESEEVVFDEESALL